LFISKKLQNVENLKRYITILIWLCSFSWSYSQEDSFFENSYLEPFIINPAFSGIEYYPSARFGVERQWIGIPDAPVTFSVSGNIRIGQFDFYDPKGFINTGPFKIKDRIGLGAGLYQDINGPLTSSGGLLSYGYHIPMKHNSELSFGLSTLLLHYGLNSSILKPDQGIDPYLFENSEGIFQLNFGFGSVYRTEKYFLGASAVKIVPGVSRINEEKKNQADFFILGGTSLKGKGSSFVFEPSFCIKKYSDYPIIVDIHSKLYIRRLNWVALSYSTTQKINIRLGLRLYRMIYMSYNYEQSLSKIASSNYGTQEISLGINTGLYKVEGLRKAIKQMDD